MTLEEAMKSIREAMPNEAEVITERINSYISYILDLENENDDWSIRCKGLEIAKEEAHTEGELR